MEIDFCGIVERFSIMAVDGGLSDLEAMKECLKKWPITAVNIGAWDKAVRGDEDFDGISNLTADARALFEAARLSAVMMMRL